MYCFSYKKLTRLGIDIEILYIQELYLESWNISYFEFNLYWPSVTDNRKDIRVLTVIRKDTLNKLIIKNRKTLLAIYFRIFLILRTLTKP